MKSKLLATLALCPLLLHAHEGHGLDGSHWHATDTALWIALTLVALALWWGRK
ncbi:MAG: hypothetical protein ACKOCZ_01515 [Betaproteobacteria bacterium]